MIGKGGKENQHRLQVLSYYRFNRRQLWMNKRGKTKVAILLQLMH